MNPDAPVAVVTGGAGALGRAIASALASTGWAVLAPAHAELDVADPAGVSAWFGKLERCDLLVNNAGLTRDRLLARMTEGDWDAVMRTNLIGTARCARAAARLMLGHGGGQVINISSHSALSGPAGQANYAAAKAALLGFTRALAMELGEHAIRVNAVLPGFLETPMTASLPEAARRRALDAHALGRFTTAEESARCIAFLAGCRNISGQCFCLDSRPIAWE